MAHRQIVAEAALYGGNVALWVKSESRIAPSPCPLFPPQLRTFVRATVTSALCQELVSYQLFGLDLTAFERHHSRGGQKLLPGLCSGQRSRHDQEQWFVNRWSHSTSRS